MSKEIQLTFPCPHIIEEERVKLQPDRRTLITSKPIGGFGLLNISLNDSYNVSPTVGIQSRASLTSAMSEPYNVSSPTATLVVRTTTKHYSFTLPVGWYTAQQIVNAINTKLDASTTASVSNKSFSISDNVSLGPSSKILVSGRLAPVLGFRQNGGTGRVVMPPWRLFARTTDVISSGTTDAGWGIGYYVVFDQSINPSYYFSVTYSVAQPLCLRCRGTGVENDYRFDPLGDVLTIEGNNLLYQGCLKIIMTALGSNIYFPWYGSNLLSSIGSKGIGSAVASITAAVRDALTNFQNLQSNQAKYQLVTPEQRLYSIDYVNVSQSTHDPTVYLVDVQVRSFSSKPVSITIVYTIPGQSSSVSSNGHLVGSIG